MGRLTVKVQETEVTSVAIDKQAVESFFLHFFTQINLTHAAATALGPTGFSVTKHRILGFATLTPGITVGELVRTLRVTHQNLNEPLRRLVDEGYLVAKVGEQDRRHKQLFATPKGDRLYRKVLAEQLAMLKGAFERAGPESARGFLEVQRQLVGQGDYEWILRALGTVELTEPPHGSS